MRVAAFRTGRWWQTAVHVVVMSSCAVLSVNAQEAAVKGVMSLERTVDSSIAPGDDFFAHANGAWLGATAIPAGKDRWGARDEIAELTRQRVARLIDDAGMAPPGSSARKVAEFRAAWLNDAAIEARGRTPVQAQLDSID